MINYRSLSKFVDTKSELPDPALKGVQGENCNVTSCQRPKSALYFNSVMNAWYCRNCAIEIEHSANASGMSFFEEIQKEKMWRGLQKPYNETN